MFETLIRDAHGKRIRNHKKNISWIKIIIIMMEWKYKMNECGGGNAHRQNLLGSWKRTQLCTDWLAASSVIYFPCYEIWSFWIFFLCKFPCVRTVRSRTYNFMRRLSITCTNITISVATKYTEHTVLIFISVFIFSVAFLLHFIYFFVVFFYYDEKLFGKLWLRWMVLWYQWRGDVCVR